MYLIVGLGNPGDRYEHTRHNVGFDVLSILSERLRIPVNKAKCQALVGEGLFEGEKVALCKPQTYMNLSGEAVKQLMRWYKLPPERLLVIYDDIDLAPGWLRVRPNGSAGTHNGMRNIVECIGTDAFPRIRVGIGGKPAAFDLADWVLSHYNSPEERKTAFDAYQSAADATLEWMRCGTASAMNKFNTKKPKTVNPPKEKPLGTPAVLQNRKNDPNATENSSAAAERSALAAVPTSVNRELAGIEPVPNPTETPLTEEHNAAKEAGLEARTLRQTGANK